MRYDVPRDSEDASGARRTEVDEGIGGCGSDEVDERHELLRDAPGK